MYKRVLISRGFLRWKVCVLNAADVEIFHTWFMSKRRAERTATSLRKFYGIKKGAA